MKKREYFVLESFQRRRVDGMVLPGNSRKDISDCQVEERVGLALLYPDS